MTWTRVLEWLKAHPDLAPWVAFGIPLVLAAIFFRSGRPKSGFRVRESDRPRGFGMPDPAKRTQKKSRSDRGPFLLEGFSLDRPPHEILGVRAQATPAEIQSAYRRLMKRFHPDRVAAPGTVAWKDAQAIAQAITDAKETLLEKNS